MTSTFSNSSTILYGKFFPNNGKIGGLCLHEAKQRGRDIAKYGTSLFGVYLLEHPELGLCNIDSSGFDDFKQQRLVVEFSVEFDTTQGKDVKNDWDTLVRQSDATWMAGCTINQFYKIVIPSDSFFLRSPHRNATVEEMLQAFTRTSNIRTGGTAVSFVAKANACEVEAIQPQNSRVNASLSISAYDARLKLVSLDTPSPKAEVIDLEAFRQLKTTPRLAA